MSNVANTLVRKFPSLGRQALEDRLEKCEMINLNCDPETKQKLQEAFSRHLGEVMAAQGMLDEKQIFECFVQAVLSGDFLKCVVQGSGAQQFIYQPYREANQLRHDYHELLYAVARNFPNETRHETALRYIREREERSDGPCMAKEEPK